MACLGFGMVYRVSFFLLGISFGWLSIGLLTTVKRSSSEEREKKRWYNTHCIPTLSHVLWSIWSIWSIWSMWFMWSMWSMWSIWSVRSVNSYDINSFGTLRNGLQYRGQADRQTGRCGLTNGILVGARGKKSPDCSLCSSLRSDACVRVGASPNIVPAILCCIAGVVYPSRRQQPGGRGSYGRRCNGWSFGRKNLPNTIFGF